MTSGYGDEAEESSRRMLTDLRVSLDSVYPPIVFSFARNHGRVRLRN